MSFLFKPSSTSIRYWVLGLLLSHQAYATTCEEWILGSYVGKLYNARGATFVREMNIELLETAIRSFQLSKFRLDESNYKIISSYISIIEKKIETAIATAKSKQTNLKSEYESLHGYFEKRFSYGAAKQFKIDHLNPIQNELDTLNESLEMIHVILADLTEAMSELNKDPILFDISMIYQLAEGFQFTRRNEEFYTSEETASVLSHVFMGLPEDLENKILQANILFEDLYEVFEEDDYLANSFLRLLLNSGKTDGASVTRLSGLFEIFNEEYETEFAAALTSMTFLKGLNKNNGKIALQIAKVIEEKSEQLSPEESLALICYYLELNKIPTAEEVAKIDSWIEKIYEHEGVSEYNAASFLAVILKYKISPYAKGEEVEEAIEKYKNKILALFDDYYSDEDIESDAASMLAIITFLIDDSDKTLVLKARGLLEKLVDSGEMDPAEAAEFTFKLLLKDHAITQDTQDFLFFLFHPD